MLFDESCWLAHLSSLACTRVPVLVSHAPERALYSGPQLAACACRARPSVHPRKPRPVAILTIRLLYIDCPAVTGIKYRPMLVNYYFSHTVRSRLVALCYKALCTAVFAVC